LKLADITEDIDSSMVLTYGGVTNGSEILRQRIADQYKNISGDNVLVTTGAAEANFLVVNSLLERGDEFIGFLPSYMQCVGMAQNLGATVTICDLVEDEGFRPNIDQLRNRVTPKTKLISLVNPNNPTGSIISEQDMHSICEIADSVDAWVICDGALRGLEAEGPRSASPVETYEKGIATGSLSKPGLMGLRIGWVATEKNLLEDCWILKDYTTLSHSGIGDHLAGIALRPEKIAAIFDRAKSTIKRHRSILTDWMMELDPLLEWVPSKAGHTGFLKYNLDVEAVDLCTKLLEQEGVLLSPGDYFGSSKHFRLRYSCEEETLTEALNRFGAFLRRRY
jgi:aspartate/methionine/tyrosine aminotransferase